MKAGLESLLVGTLLPSFAGCAKKKKYSIPFHLDHETNLGIGIQMPSWIEQRDYVEIGQYYSTQQEQQILK